MTTTTRIPHVPPGARAIRLDHRPVLTVVMVSQGDPQLVEARLGTLQAQCIEYPANIVVVRHANAPGNARLEERYPAVHWVFANPNTDPSQLRRLGLATAVGDIVAFTTDQHALPPTWIRDLVQHAPRTSEGSGTASAREETDWAGFFASGAWRAPRGSPSHTTTA